MLSVSVRVARGGFRLDARFEASGPAVALLGPSGAGKTTLLLAIAGLLRPEAGRIVLDGRVLFSSREGIDLPPERRRVGLVFQEGLLFPHLSVRANLRYGWGGPAAGPDPEAVARLLDLGPLLGRRPAGLSGGERQRVAIGRALLAGPRLLLLDEPLAGLDEGLRRRVLGHLVAVRGAGVPLLHVTHVVPEALALAEEVVVLDGGQVLATGPFARVLAEPGVLPVARRLGLANLLAAEIAGTDPATGDLLARTAAGDLRLREPGLAPGARCYLSLPAGALTLRRSEPDPADGRDVLRGRIRSVERTGEMVLVTVAGGCLLTLAVPPGEAERLGLSPGLPVACLAEPRAARLEAVTA